MKPSQDQCIEICDFAIAYLYDKFSNEKNLFRSGVSQTDVRTLQSQITQLTFSSKLREDFDPHLVAEVLITTLKDMPHPLLLDVYEDVLATELNDEDFDQTKEIIQKWAVKLSEKHFNTASALFRLLSKLAALDDNESSLLQLAYCIAPPVCRPTTSAYMSIRHMEDLKRIRPVVSFLVENYDDIFVFGLKPAKVATPSSPSSRGHLTGGTSMLVDPPQSAAFLQQSLLASPKSPTGSLSSRSGDDSSGSGSSCDRSFHLLRPNLLVMIPPSQTATGADPLSLDVDADGYGGTKQLLGHHYTDAEWGILETLVTGQVGAFVELDVDSSAFFNSSGGVGGQRSAHDDRRSGSIDSTGSGGGGHSSPQPLFRASSGPQAYFSSSGSFKAALGDAGANSCSSVGRRRKMVADCKAMRSQIFDFEQEWTRKHNRLPKMYERGAMQAVYTRYRDLKKDIRNLAAVDVQRVVRGHLLRSKTGLGGHQSNTASAKMHRMVVARSPSPAVVAAAAGEVKSNAHSMLARDLYGKYRELLVSKRDLKRRLKRFDEEFFEAQGRQPKKADKEVIRPMYQKYHEVKAALDDLKAQIELSHGPLPDDLLENDGGGSGKTTNSTVPHKTSAGSHGASLDGGSESEPFSTVVHNRGGSGGSAASRYLSSDDEGGTAAGAQDATQRLSYRPDSSPGPPAHKRLAAANSVGDTASLESLSLEKTNLHAYLKVYERDFNRQHGRPVMRQEDIQPVAHEYQRYKELKGLIRDLKYHGSK